MNTRKTIAALAVSMLAIVMPGHAGYATGVTKFNDGPLGAMGLPFSEAVRVGDMLLLSGQIGVGADGKLVEGGITAEANQALLNIRDTLERRGLSMSDVVKCTVFLADIDEWAAFNDVYVKHFSAPYPARSAFGANGLAMHARTEVECIAAWK